MPRTTKKTRSRILKIELPQMMKFSDYHEAILFKDYLKQLGASVKMTEQNELDGREYVFEVY